MCIYTHAVSFLISLEIKCVSHRITVSKNLLQLSISISLHFLSSNEYTWCIFFVFFLDFFYKCSGAKVCFQILCWENVRDHTNCFNNYYITPTVHNWHVQFVYKLNFIHNSKTMKWKPKYESEDSVLSHDTSQSSHKLHFYRTCCWKTFPILI